MFGPDISQKKLLYILSVWLYSQKKKKIKNRFLVIIREQLYDLKGVVIPY